MSDQSQVSNWNLPNALTTLRIVMVPFFGYALLHDGGDSITWRCVAFALFVAAMITDKIDGDLARARNLVTDFGKIADPIADKAITGMAFIGLSIVGDIWWWVTILVLAARVERDAAAPLDPQGRGDAGLAERQDQDHAAGRGPVRAVPAAAPGGRLRFDLVGEVLFYLSQVLLAGAVAMTMWSGFEFYRDVLRQKRGTPDA